MTGMESCWLDVSRFCDDFSINSLDNFSRFSCVVLMIQVRKGCSQSDELFSSRFFSLILIPLVNRWVEWFWTFFSFLLSYWVSFSINKPHLEFLSVNPRISFLVFLRLQERAIKVIFRESWRLWNSAVDASLLCDRKPGVWVSRIWVSSANVVDSCKNCLQSNLEEVDWKDQIFPYNYSELTWWHTSLHQWELLVWASQVSQFFPARSLLQF